ncbi:hypothetical protein PR048_024757 [Dryococelus australis]|uniref:Uncharacterized protein n=1 Tax=Dryococelus australis TaxID=614101 RepID=A0ABQ9GPG4_9NEOP|nr:hypothetical protein PR048_024757 [Dryococelus australis]
MSTAPLVFCLPFPKIHSHLLMFAETASLLEFRLALVAKANFISIEHQNLLISLHGLAHTPLTIAEGVASCIVTPGGRKEPRLPIEALFLPHITSCSFNIS